MSMPSRWYLITMDRRDEKAFDIQIWGSTGSYQRMTFWPRLQPERLAKAFTLECLALMAATKAGVKCVYPIW